MSHNQETSSALPSDSAPGESSPFVRAKRKPPIRVSSYTVELGLEICERVASTPVALARLCREPGMPSLSTLLRWLRENDEFCESYKIAKQSQVDLLVEDILEIADDSSGDLVTTEDGKTIASRNSVQRSKLRMDGRKWLASKLLPAKYGDRIESKTPAPVDRDGASQVALPESLRMELIEERRRMMEANE